MNIEPAFISSKSGEILVTRFVPEPEKKQSSLLIIPPIAEEMNKSRRMLVLMAKIACAAGYEVLIPDLFGTGDSQGDFADASYDSWISDLLVCTDLLQSDTSSEINILALRGGALLLPEFIQRYQLKVNHILLWQPVISGDLWLTQFLRLRLAASIVSEGGNKETVKDLKSLLASGKTVEVAGYELSPGLAQGIQSSHLEKLPLDNVSEIVWIEVIASEGKSILPVSKKLIDTWNQSLQVQTALVVGPAFWSTAEIAEIPKLLDITAGYLER